MNRLGLFLAMTLAAGLAACGGSSSNSVAPEQKRITISPSTADVLVGQPTTFTATVTGLSDTRVNWSVQEANGGTVTATNSGGIYTAPWPVGTYHVVAAAVGDTTLTATATVNVSAKTAFLQQLSNGQSLPFSVTPIVGTLGPDGTWSTANVIDSGTNKPVDTAIWDIFLGADGKHAVFTMMTPGFYDGYATYFYNVGIADTSKNPITVTQLTRNENDSSSFNESYWPQLSPDGQRVIFNEYRPIQGSGTDRVNTLNEMNLDSSGKQTLYAVYGDYIGWPTYSPDGKKIAVELARYLNGYWYDGIAVIDAQTRSIQQLTGNTEEVSANCNLFTGGTWYDEVGWDSMPAFSNDGSQIYFSRDCINSANGVMTELLMFVDGATGTEGIMHYDQNQPAGSMSCQPRAFADRILFSSNEKSPGSNWAFDIYSHKFPNSPVQITSNSIYDGFSIYWMYLGTNAMSDAKARLAMGRLDPVQMRLDHIKQLKAHRTRR